MNSCATTRRIRRRGAVLAGIVMLMAVLAAIFAVLTTVTVSAHRERRIDELNRAARIAADAVIELVAIDPDDWIARSIAEPVAINIDQLAPPRATVTAQLTCESTETEYECSVEVKVDTRRLNAVEHRHWSEPRARAQGQTKPRP
jgi:hypothetical protein